MKLLIYHQVWLDLFPLAVVEPTSVKIYRNFILETLINECSIRFTDVCNRYQHTFDLKQN